MKVHHLLENKHLVFSKSQLNKLSEPTPGNIEGQFKVGQVAFDNVNGKGATPNNQNVIYMGFAMELKPSQFLDLAVKEEGGSEYRADQFIELFKQGTPIASPFLLVDIDMDSWEQDEIATMRVHGHEDRGRMAAIKKYQGDVFVPVHVFASGLRARHFSEEFFAELRKAGMRPSSEGGIYAERSNEKEHLVFGRIFWDGKRV